MNKIRVSKELLINLGNYSNVKIIAEVTTTKGGFEEAFEQVNNQIYQQELIERQRLVPKPNPSIKDDSDIF